MHETRTAGSGHTPWQDAAPVVAQPVAHPAAHFAAFSFVDRIDEVQAAEAGSDAGVGAMRAAGRYHVPAHVHEFPGCLVAEAIGQLAAWVSMSQIGFTGRPVAALAGETRFHASVGPGSMLELEVGIESCDAGSVAYHGAAHVDGVCVLELERCLGPMLPAADFDDPEALRVRFELLCKGGADRDRFAGVAVPLPELVEHLPGESLRAILTVPRHAEFFSDHFPRRPVFPATLLLNEQMKLGLQLLSSANPHSDAPFTPVRMRNVKMRSFIQPGDAVEIQARVRGLDAEHAVLAFSARIDGKIVATSELELEALR